MNPVHPPAFASRLGHWLAELLLVFIGAYAAFWLSNVQERRTEHHRHDQILAELESEATESIANMTQQRAGNQRALEEFQRALAAGEMPPLHTFSFTSDYSASDTATLLQTGGYQLLDIKTIFALRKVESVERGGLSTIAHIEKLSDELIAPNLDQDISFFYDPATKKLRKRFASYPRALAAIIQFFDDSLAAEEELLARLRAERGSK